MAKSEMIALFNKDRETESEQDQNRLHRLNNPLPSFYYDFTQKVKKGHLESRLAFLYGDDDASEIMRCNVSLTKQRPRVYKSKLNRYKHKKNMFFKLIMVYERINVYLFLHKNQLENLESTRKNEFSTTIGNLTDKEISSMIRPDRLVTFSNLPKLVNATNLMGMNDFQKSVDLSSKIKYVLTQETKMIKLFLQEMNTFSPFDKSKKVRYESSKKTTRLRSDCRTTLTSYADHSDVKSVDLYEKYRYEPCVDFMMRNFDGAINVNIPTLPYQLTDTSRIVLRYYGLIALQEYKTKKKRNLVKNLKTVKRQFTPVLEKSNYHHINEFHYSHVILNDEAEHKYQHWNTKLGHIGF
jgi:hypothetical protein